MKSYIKAAVAAAVLLTAAVIIFAFVSAGTVSSASRETIAILNDITRTAEDNRSDLSVLDGTDYAADFVILDSTDNIIYDHRSGVSDYGRLSVETAIQKGYPYTYLKQGGTLWGSVILLDDGMDQYRLLRGRLIAGSCIFSAAFVIAAVCFGIYIERNIITPFRRMQSFAGRIADGDLDAPLGMDKNNLFGAFSESFDIMREELALSKKRELELQKKEREMVASLSHDLKTPVTGIKLAAELLQTRLSVKTQTDDDILFTQGEIADISADAEGIRQKAEQIDVLVSDLFTSALDDLGEFKVNCRDESSEVLADIVRSYDDKGYAVMEDIPAVIVNIDTKRMAQVIGNIISNSYKYADTAIDIGYRLSDGFLEMRIRDHGAGVPREEIDLITNKFYRGKAWENSEKEGNGLGLYIAKMLMKKMNGDLVAQSDGDGLAVTLVIPLS